MSAQSPSKPRSATRNKGGRPRLVFDLALVERLGTIGCTHEELATALGCSLETVKRQMHDPDSEFCAAFKKGYGSLKRSLRRKQIQMALDGKGNVGMLIWLGKQYLGQADQVEQRVEDTTKESAHEVLTKWQEMLGINAGGTN